VKRTGSFLAAACLAVLLGGGCLSVTWRREHRFQRPPRGSLAKLEPGTSDLADCLALLGAPLFVYETPDGFAIAYGGLATTDRGASATLPLSRSVDASFSMRDVDRRLRGAVLFFDEDYRLMIVRRGLLRRLPPGDRRERPRLVGDDGMRPRQGRDG